MNRRRPSNVGLPSPSSIQQQVRLALDEDIGTGDITAALIPTTPHHVHASIQAQEPATLCGQAWANQVFQTIDPEIALEWLCHDGDQLSPGQTIVTLKGCPKSLVSAERTALNFLQTLSGTATTTRFYQSLIAHTKATLLDTRKTIPGLRYAQKYAVACGGGQNHRLGLYDAFLIKENHIIATGSITNAIEQARTLDTNKILEIEVENLDELEQALSAQADIILLDNFNLATLKQAVATTQGNAALEASGNINQDNLAAIAETGVDYISMGALTKHIKAIDLSMRFDSRR